MLAQGWARHAVMHCCWRACLMCCIQQTFRCAAYLHAAAQLSGSMCLVIFSHVDELLGAYAATSVCVVGALAATVLNAAWHLCRNTALKDLHVCAWYVLGIISEHVNFKY